MNKATEHNQTSGAAVANKGQQETLNTKLMWMCGLSITAAILGSVWWITQSTPANAAVQQDSQAGLEPLAQSEAPTSNDRVIAVIDGAVVTQLEIADQLRTGVDKAIVVDRYINKVVAAKLGQDMYPDQAKAALRAAEREVLATVYTTRRLQDLREQVTEEDVKAYYRKNVLDENFKQWKVSYYLTTDPTDIQSTSKRLMDGDKKALEQLAPLNAEGDGFLFAQAMPYGLGRVVNSLKKGEFSEVLRVRNGFMVVRVDDVKQLDKPTLQDLTNQIIETIVLERFNSELEKARSAAKIELG